MRTPNLNSLKLFDAAARHLNFRLAAEELNLTQGAVAQRIRQLEADLGAKLFHREARGLSFTEIGRQYHSPIQRALAIIDEATDLFLSENSALTISVTPSFASKWLVPRLSAFAKIHPDIEVQTLASEGLANFQSDGIDIAIRQGLPKKEKGLHSELLAALNLCAVCSPDFLPQDRRSIQAKDFAGFPLIQDSHHHWDALLEQHGLKAKQRIIRFNQTALAMDAAANGQGITLAPRLLVGQELAKGSLIEIWRDGRTTANGFYLVYPEIRREPTARDALIHWLKSEIRQTVTD